ncbi:MAG: HypC/HybG/HupF family hydrogenase formation chaperone [Anaerolineaceae bacterium]|nr:HypC/HybG/HupF family hydrogenase formation chaperone [Anaerolineaceae bacterium]
MCLGVPGKITSIYTKDELSMCMVDFGGVSHEVCIVTLPEARIGDYILVHAGFGLNILSESEAEDTLAALRELAQAAEESGGGTDPDETSDILNE